MDVQGAQASKLIAELVVKFFLVFVDLHVFQGKYDLTVELVAQYPFQYEVVSVILVPYIGMVGVMQFVLSFLLDVLRASNMKPLIESLEQLCNLKAGK